MVARDAKGVCPHLALWQDDKTHFSYPQRGNACYVRKSALLVEISYQGEVCLGGAWPTCSRHIDAMGEYGGREPVASGERKGGKVRRGLGWPTVRLVLVSVVVAAVLLILGAMVLIYLEREKIAVLGPSSETAVAAPGLGSASAPSTVSALGPASLIQTTSDYSKWTPGPTWTPVPSWTPVRKPTASPTLSRTPKSTPTPEPTATLTPTLTLTPTPTRTPRRTPSPTLTPTPTGTPTSTPGPTRLPTQQPTPTAPPAEPTRTPRPPPGP